MTNFGKIKSYNSSKGCGTIAPERGGASLDFVKADLQQEAAEPKAGDRYGYETQQVDGGRPNAINLQQDSQHHQAQQQ